MTTHETQPETLEPTRGQDRPVETDTPRDPTPITAETEAPTTNLATHENDVGSTTQAESSVQMLFDDGELSSMRSRWADVQASFVDDPRDCVQKADALVGDVVDKLTSGFSQARSRLEEQWDRGEQVSTEDLRVALKRYREFFERLLAV